MVVLAGFQPETAEEERDVEGEEIVESLVAVPGHGETHVVVRAGVVGVPVLLPLDEVELILLAQHDCGLTHRAHRAADAVVVLGLGQQLVLGHGDALKVDQGRGADGGHVRLLTAFGEPLRSDGPDQRCSGRGRTVIHR